MTNLKSQLLIVLLFVFVLQNMNGQNIISIKTSSSMVQLEYIENNNDTLIFFNLHNNEKTAIKAIKEVLKTKPGRYLGILSGGTRELTLKEKGKIISFDPNRIFTKTGIEKTLRNYNCYSEYNFKLVNDLGMSIITHLSKAKLIVAMHNNTGVGYSINGIKKTNAQKHDASEFNINPQRDENDFFFVTEKAKFDYFKSQGFNVLLQDNTHVEDDGSLSVYCGKANISYINIECENGHLKEQIEMINAVYKGFVDGVE